MADALAGLRDIHQPMPIGWWPPAPGYSLIAALLILLGLVFLWRYHTRPTRAIKREALHQLALYQHDYVTTADDSTTAARISALLKQVALLYYPRTDVAPLQGSAWLLFLMSTSRKLDFESVRESLLDAPFQPNSPHNAGPLFPLAKAWIKQRSHRCLN